MIITVTLNPALDKTVILPGFAVNTVNRVSATRLDPGGKGINVSKVVKALGGKTLALGVLGGAAGGYIQAAMDKMELPNDMVLTGEITRTNLKIIDPLLQTNTDINEPGGPVSEETLDAVWHKLTKAVKPGDTVVLAGKNPPGMPDSRLADWVTRLHGMKVYTCVDTVGEPMQQAIAAQPDIIKPNREELAEIAGRRMVTDDDVLTAARELVGRGVGLVTASLGADGAIFVTRNQAFRGYAPKVSVVSVVGAGDAMMAALTHYSAAGCSLEETARRSIAVSVASVMCSGSEAPELNMILPLIDQVRLEKL
ncbi:MAG TPA: 1-phosphofructokinase [Candidatus Avoscillospira stercorigallinarum]|uniref:Tagatose-6-phosphate kinase n=1 Tax=Candidatus Avoscillospira stercorigallinarum TaxID=2840708 RepID=A0A9D0Z5A0_9FIRM|nr:1-phosphofructokinase [Candidatus Avoscillospira stercorigallinarum]